MQSHPMPWPSFTNRTEHAHFMQCCSNRSDPGSGQHDSPKHHIACMLAAAAYPTVSCSAHHPTPSPAHPLGFPHTHSHLPNPFTPPPLNPTPPFAAALTLPPPSLPQTTPTPPLHPPPTSAPPATPAPTPPLLSSFQGGRTPTGWPHTILCCAPHLHKVFLDLLWHKHTCQCAQLLQCGHVLICLNLHDSGGSSTRTGTSSNGLR